MLIAAKGAAVDYTYRFYTSKEPKINESTQFGEVLIRIGPERHTDTEFNLDFKETYALKISIQRK